MSTPLGAISQKLVPSLTRVRAATQTELPGVLRGRTRLGDFQTANASAIADVAGMVWDTPELAPYVAGERLLNRAARLRDQARALSAQRSPELAADADDALREGIRAARGQEEALGWIARQLPSPPATLAPADDALVRLQAGRTLQRVPERTTAYQSIERALRFAHRQEDPADVYRTVEQAARDRFGQICSNRPRTPQEANSQNRIREAFQQGLKTVQEVYGLDGKT